MVAMVDTMFVCDEHNLDLYFFGDCFIGLSVTFFTCRCHLLKVMDPNVPSSNGHHSSLSTELLFYLN